MSLTSEAKECYNLIIVIDLQLDLRSKNSQYEKAIWKNLEIKHINNIGVYFTVPLFCSLHIRTSLHMNLWTNVLRQTGCEAFHHSIPVEKKQKNRESSQHYKQ